MNRQHERLKSMSKRSATTVGEQVGEKWFASGSENDLILTIVFYCVLRKSP